jgi:uracil-DNA glycosylase
MHAESSITKSQILYNLNKSIFECSECCHQDRTIGYPYPMYIGEKSDFSVVVVGQSPGMALQMTDPIVRSYMHKLSFDDHTKVYHDSLIKAIIIQFIQKYLDLKPDTLIWTNICKCTYKNNAMPPIEDIEHGKVHLFKQLEAIKDSLKLVITLGKPAASAFNIQPTKFPIIVKAEYPIIAIYHPSYISRKGLWQYANKASDVIHNYLEIECLK